MCRLGPEELTEARHHKVWDGAEAKRDRLFFILFWWGGGATRAVFGEREEVGLVLASTKGFVAELAWSNHGAPRYTWCNSKDRRDVRLPR